MERRRITFAGTVQGVGFRATACHCASDFAVTGWVRNEPDRSVLMEVQGIPIEVDRFLVHVRARLGRFIRSEHSIPVPLMETEAAFEIRR